MKGGLTGPQISKVFKNGGIVVRHCEYIGDVTPSVAFQNQAFDLNPGLDAVFPWLSQISSAYTEYRWRGIVAEYRSMSSDAVLSTNASSSLGSVMMATQYNALDLPFTTKVEMQNYIYSNSCKPSLSMYHPIECRSNVLNKFYLRQGSIPEGSDERFYDLGNFQVATQGCQATTGSIGELWVHYEVELYKPKFKIGSNLQADLFYLTGVSNAAPLGTAYTDGYAGMADNLGIKFISESAFQFPRYSVIGSKYMIYIKFRNLGGSTTSGPLVGMTGAALVKGFDGGSSLDGSSGPPSGEGFIFCRIIELTAPNAIIGLTSGGGFNPTNANADLFVTQIPNR